MHIVNSLLLTFLTPAFLAPAPMSHEKLTEHTYRLSDDAKTPPASVEDVAWLAGHWLGEGLGGISEEVWSPPRAGAMMGAFRLVRENKPVFYEMLTIMEENGSLVFRLKHFNADLTAWEEKEKTVDFPLVAVEENAVHFQGLSLHLEDEKLKIYLALHQDDGSIQEAVFSHERIRIE